MRKVGRPPIDNPKLHKVTVRMSDEEYTELMEYNQTHDQTITETMLEAFGMLLNKARK